MVKQFYPACEASQNTDVIQTRLKRTLINVNLRLKEKVAGLNQLMLQGNKWPNNFLKNGDEKEMTKFLRKYVGKDQRYLIKVGK